MRKCSEYLNYYLNGLVEALTFDDVLLVPQYSEIESRSKVDLSTKFLNSRIGIPIISANMDTVTEYTMAETMYKCGGVGIIHRFTSEENIVSWIKVLKAIPEIKFNPKHIIPSIGVSSTELVRAENYVKHGATAICIDIAHGNSMHMFHMVREIKKHLNVPVIAGNVVTKDAALRLAEAGADAIKVGVGPGSMCTTRVVTGHGLPQIHAIAAVADALRGSSITLIADGGIRNSGDIVKALAFGADCVMVGSMLSGTAESPGEIIEVNGTKKKAFRGMASKDAQVDFKGRVSNSTPEGVSTLVDFKGRVSDVIENLKGGIRSGLTYSGVFCVEQLRKEACYVKVTGASLIEGMPHGLK